MIALRRSKQCYAVYRYTTSGSILDVTFTCQEDVEFFGQAPSLSMSTFPKSQKIVVIAIKLHMISIKSKVAVAVDPDAQIN